MRTMIKTFEFVICNRGCNATIDQSFENGITDGPEAVDPFTIDKIINDFCYNKEIISVDVKTYEAKTGLVKLATKDDAESVIRGNIIVARYTIIYKMHNY